MKQTFSGRIGPSLDPVQGENQVELICLLGASLFWLVAKLSFSGFTEIQKAVLQLQLDKDHKMINWGYSHYGIELGRVYKPEHIQVMLFAVHFGVWFYNSGIDDFLGNIWWGEICPLGFQLVLCLLLLGFYSSMLCACLPEKSF